MITPSRRGGHLFNDSLSHPNTPTRQEGGKEGRKETERRGQNGEREGTRKRGRREEKGGRANKIGVKKDLK